MRVSIVVPVFNTGKYVGECIKSIADQGIDELEIIAINDASTDNSLEVLEHLAAAEPRLKVVNLKKNLGPGPVRNMGIKLAVGKRIGFLDSDDKMQEGSLLKLLQTSEDNESELVIGSLSKQVDLENGQHRIEDYFTSRYLNFSALNTNLDQCRNLINITSSCAILYSRRFLVSKRIYYQRKVQEDHDFVLHAILEADKVSIRGDVPYFLYRRRPPTVEQKSLTSSPWSVEQFEMMVEHFERVIELFGRRKYSRRIRELQELRRTRLSYYLGTFTNHILRSVFLSNDISLHRHLLERLSMAFHKSKLAETGLDHSAESLKPNNPDRSDSGYYELCLYLILEQRWTLLEQLVTERKVGADLVAELFADETAATELKSALSGYVNKHPAGLAQSKTALPCIVPPNIDEVYIHIGMTKTGSTAIQNFLENNRDVLETRGVIYPSTGIYHDIRKHSRRTSGHHELITAIWKRNVTLLGQFRNELSESKANKLLISSENFFHVAPEVVSGLREIIGEVPVKIIVYLRQQDRWVESYYGESISGGNRKYSGTFEQFLRIEEEKSLDYFQLLQKWSHTFGGKNIIARPYTTDVIHDFSRLVGIEKDFDSFSLPAEKSNISPLTKDKLVLLREINKLPFKSRPEGYRKFVQEFVSEFGSNRSDKKVYWLSDEGRKQLLDKYKSGNRKIERKYSKGKSLFPRKQIRTGVKSDAASQLSTSIPADDLAKAMQLYFRFRDFGATVPKHNRAHVNKQVAKPGTVKHKSIAGKIYAASRGVPVFQQVINAVAPIHDRIFGVAK